MSTQTKSHLARDTYLNVVRVHERLSGEFGELFRGAGLTSAQYNVLRILLGGPAAGAPCQYVGERLLTRVPDVTRLIDRMEAADLVRRQRSTEDRRVVLVRVTPKGRRICESLENPVLELHRTQLDHLSAKSLATLNGLLAELLRRR